MKRITLATACFLLMLTAGYAQKKTQVVLLGCFHFDNPGLDVAKFENADILSAKRQQEVMAVVEKLKTYKPDKIFVEMAPTSQAKLDSAIRLYKENKYALKASEIHQLGFRLAKDLNLPTLYAVDYRDADFPFDSLMTSMINAGQSDLLNYVKSTIDSVQQSFNESLKTKTVSQLLINQNSAASAEWQIGGYFKFLAAGKPGNHVGSYLTSEWWRRNMVIYEEILKRLTGKEERILVIFGSGHTAILEAMMKYNNSLEILPVAGVL